MNDYQNTQHKLRIIASERSLHLKRMNDAQRKISYNKALLNNLNQEMSEKRKNDLTKNITNNETRLQILNCVLDVLNDLFDEANTLFNIYN